MSLYFLSKLQKKVGTKLRNQIAFAKSPKRLLHRIRSLLAIRCFNDIRQNTFATLIIVFGKYKLRIAFSNPDKNEINRQICHHIESSSQLICRANQLTGFYKMATSAFNELIVIFTFTEFTEAD